MKIQRVLKKGRGIRAILCLMVSVLCIAFGGMEVLAGYTNENHPSTVFSPDGTGWTIIDELPYMENPNCLENPEVYQSCWTAAGTPIDTGINTNLPNPGVGQHTYDYNRTGYVPVDYWLVTWERSKCIHDYDVEDYRGIFNLTPNKCWNAYWSGLNPYCADCGNPINEALHYIKPSSAATLQYVMVDEGKSYFYTCPHGENHGGVHLEQGPPKYEHKCSAVSNNRYKVVYKKNGAGAVGEMLPSFHMYDNATMLDGEEVIPDTHLHVNRFTRKGYTFAGWNTEPDGSGQSFTDGQEILNLTDEHYDVDLNPDPNHGVVTLYAQWERSVSHLQIDAKGGKYDDGVGVVNGDKTKYENQAYNSSMELSEEYLTAPMGYTVSFVTNCPTTIAPMQTQKIFNSWKKSEPYAGKFVDGRFQTVPSYEAGRLLNNVFEFVGENDVWSYIEATYDNGSIILPECENGDETLVGWYKDPGLTEIIGIPGVPYTPDEDITLYADWEKDLVLYAENDLTVDFLQFFLAY